MAKESGLKLTSAQRVDTPERVAAVEWLNANLAPWTFDGGEPIVASLVALLIGQRNRHYAT